MAIGFPPQPRYPLGYDSNRTLFLVFNTSEARITKNNSAWSEEIEIEPYQTTGDKTDQWADNGFANISGELFYYDAVERNSDGKIIKFKRCARNLGGKKTKFNPEGTWVRGYVIAEHHNQIVDVTLAIQQYILDLEEDIERLEEQTLCPDDKLCPEVTLEITREPATDCPAVTIFYTIIINGTFNNFVLDFGDGQSTTSTQSGSHVYASNADIDPIITISNDECSILQTPIERSEQNIPTWSGSSTPPPLIPIPPPPNFPEITINECPPTDPLDIPQIIIPKLDIEPISFIPPVISIIPPEITVPTISVTPVKFDGEFKFGPAPIVPTQGKFEFGPAPVVPTGGEFKFGPAPIVPDVTFEFGPAPTFPTQGKFEFGPAPTFPTGGKFEFGPAPAFPSTFGFGPAPEITSDLKFGPAPEVNSDVKFGPAPQVNANLNFGPAPQVSANLNFGPAPQVSANLNFGPAPQISSRFDWGNAPNVTGTFNWGNAPNVTGSFSWGNAPNVTGSFSWGNAPNVTGTFSWGNPPNVTGTFSWGNPPNATGTFNWGSPPPATGSFDWGSPPPVTGSFDWGVPPPINFVFDWGSPPPLDFKFDWGTPPKIEGKFNWGTPPSVPVSWGSPPTITVSVACPPGSYMQPPVAQDLDDDYTDEFDPDEPLQFQIDNSQIGIPSEIKVIAPKFPDINVVHDIPKSIFVNSQIPNRIELYQSQPLLHAHEIKLLNEHVIPKSIEIKAIDIPNSIKLDTDSLPNFISLAVPTFPDIRVDASEIPETIRVVGIPDSIEVKIPSEITAKLEIPDNLEIPLVYKGGPVPIQFDSSNLFGGEDRPCFALVPCEPKK